MSDVPRKEYPRPQFVRKNWVNLNGEWTYEFDFGRSGSQRGLQDSKGFKDKIIVPFCPESELSGVGHTDFIEQMFYHRKITVPAEWTGKQILLHFGAVDYRCFAFINGKPAGTHYGGSSSFTFNITDLAEPGKEFDFVLMVQDMLRSQVQPYGKQSYNFKSAGCSYTRTTGIWQTVWMEPVDSYGLKRCRITPDLDNESFIFEPEFLHAGRNLRWSIKVSANGKTVGSGEFAASGNCPQTVKLSEVHTWSPADPFLYDIEFKVLKDGSVIDEATSYAGLRKIHVEGDKVYLNNEPVFFRLVLDQGFYRKGIWTAPSDTDLKRDIELSMAAGFNGARLHQKVFEERFHYWADKLGYLTWGESPSWGISFGANEIDPVAFWNGISNFMHEWREIMERDLNHPSIVAWSPTNETWPGNCDWKYREIFTEIYDLTHSVDSNRLCNECSGYHHAKTDLWTVHLYRKNVEELKTAMETKPVFMMKPELEAPAYHGQPYINDEFGGFLYIPRDKSSRFADNTWGYYGTEIKSAEEFVNAIAPQVEYMVNLPECSGFCYTQLTDVEQEQNGVLTYDRVPKAPLEDLKKAFGQKKKG